MRKILWLFLLASPLSAQIQFPYLVTWNSSTPPTSCPNTNQFYVIGVGFTGAGNVYGNSGTGTTCALLATPGGGGGGGSVGSQYAAQVAGSSAGSFADSGAKLLVDAQANFLMNGLGPLPTGFTASVLIGQGAAPVYGTGTGVNEGFICIGYQCGYSATSTNGSVFIGYQAGYSYPGLGTGGEDGNQVFIGPFAGYSDTSGFENVAIGNKSYGIGSFGQGSSVFLGNHTGENFQSVANDGTGNYNIVLGGGVGWHWSNGSYIHGNNNLLAGGAIMLRQPATGSSARGLSDTVILGTHSGQCFSNAAGNTLIGADIGSIGAGDDGGTCSADFNGQGNIYILGPSGLAGTSRYANNWTSGSSSVVLTSQSYGDGNFYGGGLTTGNADILIGGGAGAATANANFQIAIGNSALPQSAGSYQIAIGRMALYSENSSSGNPEDTAIGMQALYSLTSSGNTDTATGWQAGYSTTSSNGSFFGVQAGYGDTSGQNAYFGASAGKRAAASGGYNTAVGFQAGYTSSGGGGEVGNVWLGNAASGTASYAISIGNAANTTAGGAVEIGSGGSAYTNSTANSMQFDNWNFLLSTGAATLLTAKLTGAAPTVAAAQLGLGSTTAANTNCGTTPTACWVINVAGTTRYVPYY